MNINELSDKEKSLMLAELVGWEVERGKDHVVLFLPDGTHVSFVVDKDLKGDMLYDPSFMALAWRVLNWASHSETTTGGLGKFSFSDWFCEADIDERPPADAQRRWLDKILSLAIEAGLTGVHQDDEE